MKKQIYILALTTATLFVTSCGEQDSKTAVVNAPAIPVTVQAVTDHGNSSFLAISGKVQAANSAQLSTRTMGFVKNAPVNVGDRVSKGQLLVAINNTDLQAKRAQVTAGITEAAAAFNNAQKDYNRFKNLFADNSASQKELDDMTASVNMAKARLEGAKQLKNEINTQFAYTNITAPFSGVITSKNVKNGDMASPGQTLIALESPGAFEVMALVPETEIAQIKTGTQVTVTLKSINETLAGTVKEVSPSALQTGGQYLVKVTLETITAQVRSGMFATVAFPVEKQKGAVVNVMIPRAVLVTNGQLSGVYTISSSNTAILRWLRLGRTVGDQVEVLSGLNANERFIVTSSGKLFNGAKVRVE